MTTLTQTGNKLAGLESRLYDEMDALVTAREAMIEHVRNTFNERIEALRVVIGDEETAMKIAAE